MTSTIVKRILEVTGGKLVNSTSTNGVVELYSEPQLVILPIPGSKVIEDGSRRMCKRNNMEV